MHALHVVIISQPSQRSTQQPESASGSQVESLQACRQESRVKVDCGRCKLESIRMVLRTCVGATGALIGHKGPPSRHLQSQAKPIPADLFSKSRRKFVFGLNYAHYASIHASTVSAEKGPRQV